MIHSIGYQRLTPAQLLHVATTLDATIVDVRSRPFSRKKGMGKTQLVALLGERYLWKGDILGGDGRRGLEPGGLPLPEGIAWLEAEQAKGSRLVLMCMEEAPGDCHRHMSIAIPLAARGVEVLHIYQDELVTAAALQASLDDPDPDADYERAGVSPLAGMVTS